MNRLNVLSLIATIVLFICPEIYAESKAVSIYDAPVLDKSVPDNFDLPEKYKPSKKSKRISLGFRRSYGVILGDQKGISPIYITEVKKGTIPNNALVVGDVILAVNGKALGKKAAKQYSKGLGEGRKKGFFWFTRWRKGKVERYFMDLGTKSLDLTKTLTPGPSRDWRLGPMGANGWCFHLRTKSGASMDARQIIITSVDKDGPSTNKLQVNDVIIGADDELFAVDARKAIAAVINKAEKKENKGVINLMVFRKDKIIEVTVIIPALGSYSVTAPFKCSKTETIIDNAVAYIKTNEEKLLKPSGWINFINGLGLLATGREDVMPMVKKMAHGGLLKDGEKLSVEKHVSMMCWWWSYKTIFLCEYYLRTGDKAVLSTIEEYATKISMGQSGAGTWGHTYAARANTGYLHGHLGGYGAINQQGLTLMVALPLAVKCGIRNKEVLDAIKRGNDFFSFFIGKGTIPYGDHGAANTWYDDNGKSGAAAVFFDLMDNREGTSFFCDMVLASAPSGREAGHTGHFWSHLWGGIGAAKGGDRALQVFMEEMSHIFTLERQPNGSFAFQGNAGMDGPKGDPKEKWDCTGTRLLQLCVPKRILFITGKETSKETHLTEKRIKEIFKVGSLDVDQQARVNLTQDEIIKLLQDPLPPARAMAAKTLAERNINIVEILIEMLDSKNKYARYGAAEALSKAGFASKTAADKLIKLMQSSGDVNFQTYAIAALINRDKERGLLAVAKPAIPVLMKMALKYSPDDPRKVLQNEIGRALFYNGSAQPRRGLVSEYGLEGIDRSILISVVKEILTNKNGWVRSTMSRLIYPKLTPAERKQLWLDIYKATQVIAPSGIMFASGNRTDGLQLMSKHHVMEGLDLAAWYIRFQKGHGGRSRVPIVLKAIENYGVHAKRIIPELNRHIVFWESKRNKRRAVPADDSANLIRATVKKIEGMSDNPKVKLFSIAAELKTHGIEFPPKPIVVKSDI